MPRTTFPATDTHAHVFYPELQVAENARYVPEYAATLEQYLAVLDANDIQRGVLVQPSFLGCDNSYLLDCLEREPDRLRGVIVIDAENPDYELAGDRVAQLHGGGVRGVRLNLVGQQIPDLSSAKWQAAAVELARHGWHLEIQASGGQWQKLREPLAVWPSKVVIDHLGLPSQRDPEAKSVVLGLSNLGHIWVKVSGHYRSPDGEAASMLRDLVSTGASDRLVFGSDWPFTRHEEQDYSALLEWVISQDEAALAAHNLAHNASRLLGWDV